MERTWEEVTDDAVEQGHVMAEELAEVDADDGPQHQHKLILDGELVLQVGCRQAQHSSARMLFAFGDRWCSCSRPCLNPAHAFMTRGASTDCMAPGQSQNGLL